MGGGVILVVVDASKEITDYAIEWAIGNVIKPMDFLILLALLPLSPHRHPPAAGNLTHPQYSHHVYQFFSGTFPKTKKKLSWFWKVL